MARYITFSTYFFLLFSHVLAHVKLRSPVPFSKDKVTLDPILAADYPCKKTLGYNISEMNMMQAGSSQKVVFDGSAVHGGGSCQFSISTDTEPTDKSKFKVIKSIEGGCPGVDGKSSEFDFKLPTEIPNGQVTFAWTWFAKFSGVPEMYMNCAPVMVTGGASDSSQFDQLPDMMIANLGKDCTSPQNFDTLYPNPGVNVEKAGSPKLRPPTGPACPVSPNSEQTKDVSKIQNQKSDCGNDCKQMPVESSFGQKNTVVPSSPNPISELSNIHDSENILNTEHPSETTVNTLSPVPSIELVTSDPKSNLYSTINTKAFSASISDTQKSQLSDSEITKSLDLNTNQNIEAPCEKTDFLMCDGPSRFGLCDHGTVKFRAVSKNTQCLNGEIVWSTGGASVPGRLLKRML